jgi:hypothetical protein
MSNFVKIYYWLAFGLSIVALFTSIGIGLVALGIILLPTVILHMLNGMHLKRLGNHKKLILLSGTNLLIFALVRPDGVHVFNKNGLSALLDLIGIDAGYNSAYDNHLTIVAILLLALQIFFDLRLRKLRLKQPSA